MRIKLCVLCLMFCSSPLMADQNKLFIGGALGFWSYDEQDSSGFSPISLEGVVDYEVLENLDLRLNVGVGISEETNISPVGDETTFQIDSYAGVYIKPKLTIDNITLYPLIGYSTTALDATFNDRKLSSNSSGLLYGAGVSYNFSKMKRITVEWRQQADTANYELSGFTIGLMVAM